MSGFVMRDAHRDPDAVSRTTSVSRRSTLSRSQTLIKKNIAPHDLRPSDVIIERFIAWKAIVKQLIAYFQGVADIENNTARELTKLGGVIQVPFRAGNQFLGQGGLQDIFYNIRDKTRTIADAHANLGRTIDSSIVSHLEKLRSEIKGHIRNVERDTGRLATTVARERESSTKQIAELARSIALFKNTPMAVTAKDDPYVQNILVAKQLQKQVLEENALQKSIVIMQQSSAHFEEGIVRSIQSTWQTFDEWQSRMSTTVQQTWRILGESMASLSPDREWVEFAARTDHLLDPETPLRNPDVIEYPFKNDASVIAVHVGLLERKKRWSRSWEEGYFVLTPSGWLHEYASSDPNARSTPKFSVFLPLCTLGPPSTQRSKSHKFVLEGKQDAQGSRRNSFKLPAKLGGNSTHGYTFRARSHEEMMEWWQDCRMLVARYLVASDTMDRSGPVEAAVRAVGYTSDDGEEGSEDEEGSSVEEEPHHRQHHEEPRGRESATFVGRRYSLHDEAVPAYTQNAYQETTNGKRRSGIEMGPNGYALEKKNYTPPGGYRPAEDEDEGLGQDVSANGHGADVARRPSKRQLEKAPEGRSPRMRPSSANGHGGRDSPAHAPEHDVEGGGGNRHSTAESHSRFREEV
ncbi:hypothetical protein M408DRAFT_326039 [Serendipita vermifera MAFF 305830]|uniref:PH domain-containing protein n=1 Tax=Serendipita vermifera MAFF 305830 TaxID=933852 RepID=A0A0C2XWK6_SERVB|nr:hypothetical protein M408DRAFT_326039 [Serendipita vermifera MAFF 305830]